jgi:[ribosomal protein S5]-alanine N-acetyltransferase
MYQPKLILNNIILDSMEIVKDIDIVNLANDLRVSKYINTKYPYCINDAKLFKENAKYGWKNDINFVFGIFINNLFIGTIGLCLYKGDYNCGYWIGFNYNNKGYTTKALNLLLNWSAYNFNLKNVYAEVCKENIASERVLEKNGFLFLEQLEKPKQIKGNTYIINKWCKSY